MSQKPHHCSRMHVLLSHWCPGTDPSWEHFSHVMLKWCRREVEKAVEAFIERPIYTHCSNSCVSRGLRPGSEGKYSVWYLGRATYRHPTSIGIKSRG